MDVDRSRELTWRETLFCDQANRYRSHLILRHSQVAPYYLDCDLRRIDLEPSRRPTAQTERDHELVVVALPPSYRGKPLRMKCHQTARGLTLQRWLSTEAGPMREQAPAATVDITAGMTKSVGKDRGLYGFGDEHCANHEHDPIGIGSPTLQGWRGFGCFGAALDCARRVIPLPAGRSAGTGLGHVASALERVGDRSGSSHRTARSNPAPRAGRR